MTEILDQARSTQRMRDNDALRERSGAVDDQDALVGFLYVLMRDHLTPGDVEELVRRNSTLRPSIQFTNGWLAQYAQDLATRLRDTESETA